MPMPAENIIATQETVLNSGSSSSRPSGMLPYLLIASHSTKTTKALEVVTNSQPAFVIVQSSELPETVAREEVLTNPQTRNATAIAAVTPKTTLSRPARSGSAASTCTSSAGCGITSGGGVELGDLGLMVCVKAGGAEAPTS